MMAEVAKTRKTNTKKKEVQEILNLEKLLKLLECPVCWKRCDPETLTQCRNGHFGCKSCFSRLKTCPICRFILEPEIQTFDQETLQLIKEQLRHVESSIQQLDIEAIVQIFKCRSCKFISTMVPVLQCSKGHVFCSMCSDFSKICIPCSKLSSELSEKSFTIRNLVAQDILHSIVKPCRFNNHGCAESIKGFSHHEANCQYYVTYCIVPHCLSTVSLPKLLCHILEECTHRTKLFSSFNTSRFSSIGYGAITMPWLPLREVVKSKSKCCYGNILKLGDDEHFMFVCVLSLVTSRAHFYTYFLGVPKEAEKYFYTLDLKARKDGPNIKRKAPVISACEVKFSVHLKPDVIMMPFSDIREAFHIGQSDFEFCYKVQVFENN